MNRKGVDVLVGLFVLLGFGALVFLALRAGNMSSSLGLGETYQVVAKFDNVGGLKPRAAVKGSGVVIGRVESITFDDKSFQARVTLALQSQYAFPKDSSLKILTSGLLGEQYIGIEPGAGDQNLKQGDTISSTQSAVVLENLISQFLYSKAEDSGNTGKPAGPRK